MMAYIAANSNAVSGSQGRIAEFFVTVRQVLADRKLFNQTVKELNALDERELADLGMHRADIISIAHRSVYGE